MWHNIDIIYAESGQLNEAVSEFEEVLKNDPQSEKAWNNLAIIKEGIFNYIIRMESVDYSLKKDMRTYQKFNKYLKNNIRWLVKGEPSNTLKELLDSIEYNKNLETVHRSSFKKILKYTHNQESFYIKQYIVRGNLGAIKSLFSISKAKKEWNHNHLLLKNHVPIVEPVAVGEKRRFGIRKHSYIITKAIPNTKTLKELLIDVQISASDYRLSIKNTLLVNLISYVKVMNDQGIFHGDLHTGNILVNQGNSTLFYLIDFGRTKYNRRGMSLSWRIKELSILLYSVTGNYTSNEIIGLINSYSDKMLDQKGKKVFIKKVVNRLHKIRRRRWYKITRKCLKNNNTFKFITYDKYTINMRNEWDVHLVVDLVNKHTLSLVNNSENVIKSSIKTGITRLPVSNETIKHVCAKEYKYPSLLKRLGYSFFHSSARRAWFDAHGLIASKFLTPKPIALLEEKRFGILKKSFLIMEDISDCLPCNQFIIKKFYNKNDSDSDTLRQKRRFISCLANSLNKLHDSGIYHSDLKENNIMMRESSSDWDFFYIDLDRVYFNKKVTLKKRIKNLVQLNASIPNFITYTDRLRFYQTYTEEKILNDENKRIIRSIIRLCIQRNLITILKTT